MDLGKAFSYVFDDPKWTEKVLLGGVIGIVPILNFATYGYALEVTQRVIHDNSTPLPEWDNLAEKFIKGLLIVVIQFVYALPLILLACLVTAPIMILDSGSSSGEMSAGSAVILSCFSCLALLYSLVLGIVLPAAIGNYAAKGAFGAAFRFGDVFSLVQKNLALYAMVLIIAIIASFIAGLGSIACLIGAVFTTFYSYLVMGHAAGQAYREASTNIGLV